MRFLMGIWVTCMCLRSDGDVAQRAERSVPSGNRADQTSCRRRIIRVRTSDRQFIVALESRARALDLSYCNADTSLGLVL
jgi:hypothetical protein